MTRRKRARRTPAKREEDARARERALDHRDLVLTGKEEELKARVETSARTSDELREANERLVVATVNAQAMMEVAQQATAQMSFMAEHDFLTGLPNRALLTDRLTQALALARRHGGKVALLYLDLDHFKHVNDSLGHGVGDRLLQSVASRLQACVRLSDTVSRQGGDEFVVLLSEVGSAEDAAQAAEKLLASMAEPHLIGTHRFHVTLSIGVSIFPDDGVDMPSLMMSADTAMYIAKRHGRNGYRLFTPDMNVRAMARRSVEQTLHHALEHHEFVLQYQPKVDLQTGAITGAEALIRIAQPEGLVPPLDFVRVAEDCGLILPIGRWVLKEACRQAVEWLDAGLRLPQISVNVSAIEFHGKEFLSGVTSTLRESGLRPSLLELELTESGLVRDTETTVATLAGLKALGVQIAIDDFGTGYSSLSYLRRFAIDALKIDQSFVQEIDGTQENPIVSAVIALGLSLHHKVVAEGVETQEQLAFLKGRHCAEGQGYLFSRPLSADAFGELLRSSASA